MTVFLRDASHYDGTISYAGLAGLTSKATEGTAYRDPTYGAHLNAAKAAGLPVLGSYHVVRTPGSGEGTLAQQLAYWVAYQDAETPWWRTWPHWIMQADCEHWPNDTVSASTVLQFADLMTRSGLPGWKVTYASKGQYGDTLRGIKTPLWNANYGSNTGTYPGDNAAAWGAYSGQTPVLLQYASKGYDHDAYRGTVDQLKALVGGASPAPTPPVSEETMGLIAKDAKGQYYHCLGGVSYPLATAQDVADVRHLAAQGMYQLAVGKGNDAEWTDGGLTRLGWNPATFGPMYQPAGAVALTDAQVQTIITGLGTQVGGKLDEVLAKLNNAGKALDS